jgi:hypothetical protein
MTQICNPKISSSLQVFSRERLKEVRNSGINSKLLCLLIDEMRKFLCPYLRTEIKIREFLLLNRMETSTLPLYQTKISWSQTAETATHISGVVLQTNSG